MFSECLHVFFHSPELSHGDKTTTTTTTTKNCFVKSVLRQISQKRESKGPILASAAMSAAGDPWSIKHETDFFFFFRNCNPPPIPPHTDTSVSSDSAFKQAATNNLQTNIAWDLIVVALMYVCAVCFVNTFLLVPHLQGNYLLGMLHLSKARNSRLTLKLPLATTIYFFLQFLGFPWTNKIAKGWNPQRQTRSRWRKFRSRDT